MTSLLPSKTASEFEHATSTTVPGFTGNCVVVFIVPAQSVFSPVQPGAGEIYQCQYETILEYKLDCLTLTVIRVKLVYPYFSQNQKGFGCIVAAVIGLSFVFLKSYRLS